MKTHCCLSAFLLLFLLSFCKKEFDIPPLRQASEGAQISIAQIKSRYFKNINYKFRGDSNLYCLVTADEVSGNLYKDVFVRDGSGALHVKLTQSGGLYIGDSIRINLKGVVLNEYNCLIQLDSVDLAKNVVKLASGQIPQPKILSLEQVLANTSATNPVQSQLVKINGLEFKESDRNVALADAIGKTSKNLTLKSCSEQSISLRSSGYANFASQLSPSGNGYIIAIVGQYGDQPGAMQLTLRQFGDLQLNGLLCSTFTNNIVYHKKDFNDNNLLSGGWTQVKVSGDVPWNTSSAGGAPDPYAKISNYISGANKSCETWLISPFVNLLAANKPILTFQNAFNYTGAALELYISTNYISGLPSSADWTKLSFDLSEGNWNFVNSGNVNLTSFKSSNTRIAFKYIGNNDKGSTWEVDDILIREE